MTDQRHEQRVFEVVVEGVAIAKTLNGASCQRAKPLCNIILAEPKIRRKFLVKNLPSFLAAIAAAGFVIADSL